MLRKGDFTTPGQPVSWSSFFISSQLTFSLVVILANNFDILLGKIEVTVPWVEDGDDYLVVCEFIIIFFIERLFWWTEFLIFI